MMAVVNDVQMSLAREKRLADAREIYIGSQMIILLGVYRW